MCGPTPRNRPAPKSTLNRTFLSSSGTAVALAGKLCRAAQGHIFETSRRKPLRADIFAFHHIGVAVRRINEPIQVLKNLFGYDVVSGPFDDPIQNVTVCFLSRGAGDPLIELVAPLGPNSPVDQFLKKGGGTYHVCYEVPDMAAAIQHLTSQKSVLLSGPSPAVAFGMRPIAWLMTKANLLVELVRAKSEAQPEEIQTAG
jgi:methylmalonyl-CoA/ethylmalonyl-CoA epimerase